MSCLANSYSKKGSASLTAKASLSEFFSGGLDRQTLACKKTPGPRMGNRAGGSQVARTTSGTHFFPQSIQGTNFMLVKGANRWW